MLTGWETHLHRNKYAHPPATTTTLHECRVPSGSLHVSASALGLPAKSPPGSRHSLLAAPANSISTRSRGTPPPREATRKTHCLPRLFALRLHSVIRVRTLIRILRADALQTRLLHSGPPPQAPIAHRLYYRLLASLSSSLDPAVHSEATLSFVKLGPLLQSPELLIWVTLPKYEAHCGGWPLPSVHSHDGLVKPLGFNTLLDAT